MAELHGIKISNKLYANKLRAGQRKRHNPVAFKGYPGLTHTAKQIAQYIPKCETYLEPFAGLGRIAKRVQAETMILNDLSDFAVKYLRKHFPKATITQMDFADFIWLYDSANSYKFIDPPWEDALYAENPLSNINKTYKQIYQELHDWLPNLQGDWMIAGAEFGPLTKWGWHHKLVESDKPRLFGKKAKTHLVSNLSFVVRHTTLDKFT